MAKNLDTYLDWRDELLVGVELRVRGRSRHPGPRDDEGGGRGMPQPRAAPVAGRAGQVRLPAAPAVAGTAARSPVDQGARRRHRRLLRLKKGKRCFILSFHEKVEVERQASHPSKGPLSTQSKGPLSTFQCPPRKFPEELTKSRYFRVRFRDCSNFRRSVPSFMT